MKKIELEEQKLLQLEVLDAFHHYCVENNLKYSLACGSLIGAIRHNGYIPWDDDIDVFMMRDDYDTFIKSFPDAYRTNYKVISFERNNNWCRAYANMYDERTLKIENKTSKEVTIGINIDIFPLDNVPNNTLSWKLFDSIRRALIYILTAKYVVLGNRSFFKKLFIVGVKFIFFPFSAHGLAKLVDKYAQLFNKKTTKRVFENVCGIIQKNAFDRTDFDEVIFHDFESYQFYIMKGYDDYLTKGYGNYMQFPPVEKRVSHHNSAFYWK